MEDKKLDVYITDTINDIDLKIFEEEINEVTCFTLGVHKKKDNSRFILKVDEETAAIIFEGLNQIFVEDDSDYQRPSPEPDSPQEIDVTQVFFDTLKKCDKKHFCSEDEDDDGWSPLDGASGFSF